MIYVFVSLKLDRPGAEAEIMTMTRLALLTSSVQVRQHLQEARDPRLGLNLSHPNSEA